MHQLMSQDIPEIDSWLETLFQCKQLDEDVIRKLCEKVYYTILGDFFQFNAPL